MNQTDEYILQAEHITNYYSDNGLGILGKSRRTKVLDDVSLKIRRDEFFGLVGESGCGKTTLANAILGLIPCEGTIQVGGITRTRKNRSAFTGMVQAVFQDPLSALDPRRTVGFTMREPLRAQKIGTRKEQEEAVRHMLELVGLDASYATRYPRELSGGQRQRVCIGAALIPEPDLVIADEPVSALDVCVAAQILNLFNEIDTRKDFSMLFISHNLSVVYYLCDRIAVMYHGHIVEQGSAQAVCNDPRHPYTRVLLSAVPGFEPPDSMQAEGRITVPAAGKPVHPEACCYYDRCPEASPACLNKPVLQNVAPGNEEEHLAACHHRMRPAGDAAFSDFLPAQDLQNDGRTSFSLH